MTAFPQSPPWATYLVAKAAHKHTPGTGDPDGFRPGASGLPEKPWPGNDGMTRSKASAAYPPYAVGSVRGPMILSCSTTSRAIHGSQSSAARPRASTHMDEVDVQPVDLGDELRKSLSDSLGPRASRIRPPTERPFPSSP